MLDWEVTSWPTARVGHLCAPYLSRDLPFLPTSFLPPSRPESTRCSNRPALDELIARPPSWRSSTGQQVQSRARPHSSGYLRLPTLASMPLTSIKPPLSDEHILPACHHLLLQVCCAALALPHATRSIYWARQWLGARCSPVPSSSMMHSHTKIRYVLLTCPFSRAVLTQRGIVIACGKRASRASRAPARTRRSEEPARLVNTSERLGG